MSAGDNKWAALPVQPPDAIFGLAARAAAATDPKANLVIGAYRDEQGKPYPLKVVREAERKLLDLNMNYEYLPVSGYAPFIHEALRLLYDEQDMKHVVGVQTLSGTGAVWLGAEFLTRVYDKKTTAVYLSNPTWVNHHAIFKLAGWEDIRTYRYYDPKTITLDFEGMKADIQQAPEQSIFVLHQCAHNPTGFDPTHAQWDELAELMLAKKHQVFFDSAYQGYASGDLREDSYAARTFMRRGIEYLCAQSFSKNLGLYNERVGTLSVVLRDPTRAAAVLSNLIAIICTTYATPPSHGARIVHLVLSDKELRKQWQEELVAMSSRIYEMRRLVYEELQRLQTPGKWDHIMRQIGMFSYLGLTREQCQYCQDHNVFIMLDGRANMAGLTKDTALLLARTIDQAVRTCKSKL